VVLLLLSLIIAPVTVSAANYLLATAVQLANGDRSSAGLLPNASEHSDALIRVFAARTVRWRGIFAVHTWSSSRGAALRAIAATTTRPGVNLFASMDLRGRAVFGAVPETVVSVDGKEAEQLFQNRSVIENYRFRAYGDYSPGPVRTQTRSFRPL